LIFDIFVHQRDLNVTSRNVQKVYKRIGEKSKIPDINLDIKRGFKYHDFFMNDAWIKVEAFRDYCRDHPVSPLLRLLLTSDGTVVGHLNALFLRTIEVEVQAQSEVLIDDELAAWLEIPKGEKGVERKIWLTEGGFRSSSDETSETSAPRNVKDPPAFPASARGEKRIYAISTFPISRLKPDFYHDMKLGRTPLGRMIEERRLSTRRDQMEIGHRPFPEVAKELGLSQDQLFWARRYRLTISERASGAIFEIFSPHFSSFSF
jgi:chorismate-pyruvate lyase